MLTGVLLLLVGPPKSDKLKGRDQIKFHFTILLLYYFSYFCAFLAHI